MKPQNQTLPDLSSIYNELIEMECEGTLDRQPNGTYILRNSKPLNGLEAKQNSNREDNHEA